MKKSPNRLIEDKEYFEKPVPARVFTSLAQLDRYRKLCLGLPVPVSKYTAPWGYVIDPNDPTMCLPDDKALRLLLKVKTLLKDYSYKEMAQWLTNAGYPISHNGLHKLIMTRQPFIEIVLPLEERMKL